MSFNYSSPALDPQIVDILRRAEGHAALDDAMDKVLAETIGAEPTMLNSAWALALWRHKIQKDKNGLPYWTHLESVRAGVEMLGGTEQEQVAAVLHDIVEDTPETITTLADYGFPFEVLLMVQAVTKKPNEDNRLYIGRVIEAGESAMFVKLADLYTNTDPKRLATLPETTQDRLLYKYYHAIRRIEDALGFTRTVSDADYDKSQEYTVSTYVSPYTSPKNKPAAKVTAFPRDKDGHTMFMFSSIIIGDMFPDKRTVTKVDKKVGKVTLLMSDGNIVEGPNDVRIPVLDNTTKDFVVANGRLPKDGEINEIKTEAVIKSYPAISVKPKKESILLPPLPTPDQQPAIPNRYTPKVSLIRVQQPEITDDIVSFEDAYAMIYSENVEDGEIAAGMAYIDERISQNEDFETLSQDDQSALIDEYWLEFSGEVAEGMAWQT